MLVKIITSIIAVKFAVYIENIKGELVYRTAGEVLALHTTIAEFYPQYHIMSLWAFCYDINGTGGGHSKWNKSEGGKKLLDDHSYTLYTRRK